MPDIQALVDAVQSRAWYPAAALLLTILVSAWKQLQPKVWERIPQKWQWLPIVSLAALGAFIDAAASGVQWEVALGMALYALLAALTGIGAHHTAKRVGASDATLIALALVPLMTGCAGSFEESKGTLKVVAAPRDTARCRSLDAMHRDWGAIGKASAVLAGASGLATIPAESAELDVALAAGSVAAGAVAAGAVFVSESSAVSWSSECSQ